MAFARPVGSSLFRAAALRASCQRLLKPDLGINVYAIVQRSFDPNLDKLYSRIADAVSGKVSCVQWRDHVSDPATIVREVTDLKTFLGKVPLFINTRNSAEIAHAVKAAGAFLEESQSHSDARKLLGHHALLGCSVTSLSQLKEVEQAGLIDYVSVKVFESRSWGLDGLQTIRKLTKLPIVAVGGINHLNAKPIFQRLDREDGVACALGILGSEHPDQMVRLILAARARIHGWA